MKRRERRVERGKKGVILSSREVRGEEKGVKREEKSVVLS